MSAAYVRAARKAALPPSQKRVLIALCEACTESGACDVFQRALAHRCSIHPRTVSHAIYTLQKRGYIQIQKHPNRPGNRYRITDPEHWRVGAASTPLFRTFPNCSLLKPHAISIHERP